MGAKSRRKWIARKLRMLGVKDVDKVSKMIVSLPVKQGRATLKAIADRMAAP
jgi:hypothetical protein